MSFNQSLFQYLNGLAGKSLWFDTLTIFIAQYLGYWLVVAAVFFLFFCKNRNERIKILFYSAFSVFLARAVITEIIRYFYYSPRPFAASGDVYQLISHSASGSFPSGHTAILFALAVALALGAIRSLASKRKPSFLIVFFIGAILVGVARIIAGIHWPYDILGGAIIGILSSIAIYLPFKKHLQKRLE